MSSISQDISNVFISNQDNLIEIKIPFPPSIREDDIVQLHLVNGIRNVNRTMNAFMIYRKEFNNTIKSYNIKLKDISKYASISWKQEPKHVKKYYEQLAKKVKELFKERTHSLYFINSNLASNINDNNVSLDDFNSPFLNTNRNVPSHFDDQNPPSYPSPLNHQNSPSPYAIYPFPNMSTLVFDNFDNFDNFANAFITMDDDQLINYIPEDLALTYRAILQSIPF